MLDAGDAEAEAVAEAFGLGAGPVLSGPVACGEVGQVWRLTTSRGEWAVKETFEPPLLGEVDDAAAFQEFVAAADVRVPVVRRTLAGAVMADVRGVFVRVSSWGTSWRRSHEPIRSWLDPARGADSIRNQARVEEFLSGRCTADIVTMLLDALH